jgi:hypothetical protein
VWFTETLSHPARRKTVMVGLSDAFIFLAVIAALGGSDFRCL